MSSSSATSGRAPSRIERPAPTSFGAIVRKSSSASRPACSCGVEARAALAEDGADVALGAQVAERRRRCRRGRPVRGRPRPGSRSRAGRSSAPVKRRTAAAAVGEERRVPGQVEAADDHHQRVAGQAERLAARRASPGRRRSARSARPASSRRRSSPRRSAAAARPASRCRCRSRSRRSGRRSPPARRAWWRSSGRGGDGRRAGRPRAGRRRAARRSRSGRDRGRDAAPVRP